MSDTPQDILDEIQRVKDEGLTELSLRNLNEIPDEIGNLSQLTQLYLSGSYSSIPDSLGNLSQLILLYLRGSYSNIPDWIGNLSQLTRLSLNGSYSSIPDWIGNLSQLTLLYLRGSYSSIPDWIGNLSQLTLLSLNGSYSSIPDWIGNLSQLTRLSLNGSYSSIPDSLGNLSQLTLLSLNGSYSSIPDSLGNLSQLTRLSLHSSVEITSPPPEVIGSRFAADIEAIRQYFADLKQEGDSPLYEAKLLIVGQPEAGKTSLAVKILDENASMPPKDATTRGIDIEPWEFELPNNENFRVNIWDFGGQEIYHATHQFFLTKDSVYVLVLDNRSEDDNLIYWLQAIEILSQNSPVLIIKNERDNRARNLNNKQLQDRFKNIQAIKDVNLGTNQGLSDVKAAIQDYMQTLPHFGTLLPQSWVDIRDALENDARNFVTYQQYLEICAVNNLHDEQKAHVILGYLHSLGVCLHFEDDALLSKIVILKPEWATTAVYAVLDNNIVIKNHGVFTLNDLVAIWQQDDYTVMKFELLNLMKKFQICYAMDDTTYIASQLLEDAEPDYDWDNRNNLMLRYKYDFMPKGILSRLIVVMHELIFDDKKWKSGVIIHRNKAYAEIKENYKGNEITIRTHGFNRDGLLHTIMYEIEKLHKPFGKQLKFNKQVPCNCPQCQHDTEPHFYDFSYIEGLAQRNIPIACPRSYEMIDARSLLKDITQRNKDVFDTTTESLPLIDKSAFISYKRVESWSKAELIHRELTVRGIDAFYDNDDLGGGDFSKKLIQEIVHRDNLIVVLVPETLNSDWVVREVKMAFDLDKNVVPVLIDGLKMEDLDIPDEIAQLRNQNAINFSQEHQNARINKLVSFLK